MKAGEFPLYEATEVELTAPVIAGGHRYDVGTIIQSDDIAVFRHAGIRSVQGVFYEVNDVPLKTASDILLRSLCGDFLCYVEPNSNGLCSLYADEDGVFVYEPERLNRLNEHSENILLSVLPPYTTVYKGQYLGTLKLFSSCLNEKVLNDAVTKISGMGALLKIFPYKLKKIAVIQTGAETDITELRRRYSVYGFSIAYHNHSEHSCEEIEKHVRLAIENGSQYIFVESDYPPVSRDDIVPKAFTETSAVIDRMNWPLGEGAGVVFASRKEAKLIGFSWNDFKKLDNLFRFISTDTLPDLTQLHLFVPNSISIEQRLKKMSPFEEEKSVHVGQLSDSDKIGIVILAAGESRRMAGKNKLLEDVGGQPMIQHVVEQALMSGADYVVVVTGHQSRHIEKLMEPYDVKIVKNADYLSGILGSVRLGIGVLPPDAVGALIMPADMPAFEAKYMADMMNDFRARIHDKQLPVVACADNGFLHNPVLWPRNLFNDIKIIPEDSYMLPILVEHTDYLIVHEIEDPLVLTDINSRGELEEFVRKMDYVGRAEADLEKLLSGN